MFLSCTHPECLDDKVSSFQLSLQHTEEKQYISFTQSVYI